MVTWGSTILRTPKLFDDPIAMKLNFPMYPINIPFRFPSNSFIKFPSKHRRALWHWWSLDDPFLSSPWFIDMIHDIYRSSSMFNGNSRIHWYGGTLVPYKAIFWGYIILHRSYIGLIYGTYLLFRFLKWPSSKFISQLESMNPADAPIKI